jgi:hypothetical protein
MADLFGDALGNDVISEAIVKIVILARDVMVWVCALLLLQPG